MDIDAEKATDAYMSSPVFRYLPVLELYIELDHRANL